MKKEIYKLMAIRAARTFMVVIPILALYFVERGLTIRDIFVLQVIFSIAIVLLEIPSGYFADTFGRKQSLVVGTITGAFGFVGYYVSGGFWGFAITEMILAVSAAFLSGADSAFLYDTLVEYGKESTHIRYEGKMQSLMRISEATASLLGGFLATIIAFQGVVLVEVFVMALSIPIAFSLREPKRHVERADTKQTLFQIVRFALHENRKLRYLNIFTGVISATTLTMVWFTQPYWSELSVPLVYFGVMWAGLNLLTAIGAHFSHILEKFFSFRALFGFVAVMPLVLYGVLSFGLGQYALFVIPLFWIVRGIYHPISLDYINRETSSDIRATVVSVGQLFSRLVFAGTSPFLGWMADIWSIETAFLGSAIIFGVLALLSFYGLYGAMRSRSHRTA